MKVKRISKKGHYANIDQRKVEFGNININEVDIRTKRIIRNMSTLYNDKRANQSKTHTILDKLHQTTEQLSCEAKTDRTGRGNRQIHN